MRRIKPNPVRHGALISVVAPSSIVNVDWLNSGETKAERFGYHLNYTRQILGKDRFWAGNDADRAEDFLEALESPDTQAVWCARGGYGAIRILDVLDAARVASRVRALPKLIMGYSDTSILHAYFWRFARVPGLHCPLMATPSWMKLKKDSAQAMFDAIGGKMGLGRKSHSRNWKLKSIGAAKEAEGVILGGNLTTLCSLIGTPWQPDFKGAILFLEDCNEAPYRLDRMLVQLTAAGLLQDLRGVLLGDFSEGVPKEHLKANPWPLVFQDHFRGLDIPILSGLPLGHGKQNEWLPLGIQARITKSGELEYLEQLVELDGSHEPNNF